MQPEGRKWPGSVQQSGRSLQSRKFEWACEGSAAATKEVGTAVKQAGAATTSIGLFIKNRANNPAAAAISVGGELTTCVTANWDLPPDVILTCGCPRNGE